MNHTTFWKVSARIMILFTVLLVVIPFRATADEAAKETVVSFRDIHRDGNVKLIGNLGIPVGRMVTLEGRRAKPLKTTNGHTLQFQRVNGKEVLDVPARLYPRFIQITNVDVLPKNTQIVVEGYEFVQWIGDPDRNWHLEVSFVVTKVISPKSLKIQPKSQ